MKIEIIQHRPGLTRREALRGGLLAGGGLLVATRLLLKPPEARGSGPFLICVGIFAVLAIGGVIIIARRCETKPYCVSYVSDDGFTNQHCQMLTKSRASEYPTNRITGPHTDLPTCNIACSQMPTNTTKASSKPVFNADNSSDQGDTLPGYVRVERAGRLQTADWQDISGVVELDTLLNEQEVWFDPFVDGRATAFYRFAP